MTGTKQKPNRPPTHSSVELGRLMKLASELDELAEEGPVTETTIAELAEERGVDVAHYFAALPLSDVEPEGATSPTFVVCVGGCQQWGALDCVEALMEERESMPLAIRVKDCLDQCQHAPAIELHTEGGKALIEQATPESLRSTLSELTT